jgi:hypothetical protein
MRTFKASLIAIGICTQSGVRHFQIVANFVHLNKKHRHIAVLVNQPSPAFLAQSSTAYGVGVNSCHSICRIVSSKIRSGSSKKVSEMPLIKYMETLDPPKHRQTLFLVGAIMSLPSVASGGQRSSIENIKHSKSLVGCSFFFDKQRKNKE